MPQNGQIPIEQMIGGAEGVAPPTGDVGMSPEEGPIDMMGPPEGGGELDPEAFLELIQIIAQADPEFRERVIARLQELQSGGGEPGGMPMPMDAPMPGGPPGGAMPPDPGGMPMDDAPGTPFLDRLRTERQGGR